MFQITAYNTDYPDMIGFSRNATLNTVNSTNHHLNADTCFWRFDQFINDLLIGQRIDLNTDIRIPAFFCLCNLPIHQLQNLILQTFRCYHKRIHMIHRLAHGQCLKYRHRILSDFRIGSHQWKIRIKPRRFLVIISGTDLGNVFDLSFFPSGNEAEFGMNF